jgi:two-component system OmpR family response regulator
MNNTAERVAVVIEDDADIQEILKSILLEAGFEVKVAGTGAEGIALVTEFDPVLTTVDVNMPGMDGFETVKRLRMLSGQGIIMISARFDEIDVVRGLTAGADDFLAKPFRTGELRARIDALGRRGPAAAMRVTTAASEETTDLWQEHDGLRLHADHRIVEVSGVSVALTRSEFDLLESLFLNKNRVHTKAELVRELHGDSYTTSDVVTESDARSLGVHVANVRKKLGRTSAGLDRIETVHGVGYRLRAPAV